MLYKLKGDYSSYVYQVLQTLASGISPFLIELAQLETYCSQRIELNPDPLS